jgi:hypothetical protein
MRALLPFLSLAAVSQALWFYIDGTTSKCFFEELPKDTLVVGHYSAEEWDPNQNKWAPHDGIAVYITVDVRSPSRPKHAFLDLHPFIPASPGPRAYKTTQF